MRAGALPKQNKRKTDLRKCYGWIRQYNKTDYIYGVAMAEIKALAVNCQSLFSVSEFCTFVIQFRFLYNELTKIKEVQK